MATVFSWSSKRPLESLGLGIQLRRTKLMSGSGNLKHSNIRQRKTRHRVRVFTCKETRRDMLSTHLLPLWGISLEPLLFIRFREVPGYIIVVALKDGGHIATT